MSHVEIRPLTAHVGAELHGVDLAALGEESIDTLRTALLAHHVVFVPGQHLGPESLLRVARVFGDVEVNPMSPKADGFPEITELVTYDGGSPDIWHFDTSFKPVPPPFSLLSMVKSPPVGGDTLWISTHAVYDSLSPAMQQFLRGLTVVYDSAVVGLPGHVAEHPVILDHPQTGRPALHFDPMFATRAVQLDADEGAAVLGFLRSRILDPTFACRYRWEAGTFAMWDNRCTLHRVASDFVGERIIQRATVAGNS